MNPWYILVFVAVCGAMVATVFSRYFTISAYKYPAANKLLVSIRETLAWTENPDKVFGQREDISPETFCDFLGACWPWEQKKLISIWFAYHREAGGVSAKAPILRKLLTHVERYSGFA